MVGVVIISTSLLFLVLLLFKICYTAVKIETNLAALMPYQGLQVQASAEDLLEVTIEVTESGKIILNEEVLSSADLDRPFRNLVQEAADSKAKLMVTIAAEEQAKYEQVVEVLNALAKAKITNVTFTVEDDDF